MSSLSQKSVGKPVGLPTLKTSASILTLITASGFVGYASAQTVILDGNTVTVTSQADGEMIQAGQGVTSTVDGAPVVLINTNDVTLDNDGTLATVNGSQTVQVGADTTGATINNSATGVLNGDSRVVQIDGTGATLNNDGEIIGTGDQRNGTVYTNATATDFTLNNTGTIGAGAGNQGAGFSAEGVADGTTINIDNSGTIQGRGQAGAGAATAGDGIRFERTRVAGMLDGTTSALVSGTINNSGTIDSESTQGTAAGIRFVNGVSFNGTINNSGTISGAQNGLYFGNATPAGGGDFTGAVVNNSGIISSDSRAFNLDGTGLTVNNSGEIIGTGDQRNGTLYADGTADNFTINNLEDGIIDAGFGNNGSGIGIEIGGAADGANTFTIINDGTILGNGDAPAGTAAAGDGIRIGNVGNIGTAEATIVNNGLIASEGANGTVAGVRFVNGVSFSGTFDNNGIITGVQNGVYFGNPVMGEGADHSNGVFNNNIDGIISSDSRAFNIDGLGLTLNNDGLIVGTGDQRNGTLYADGTADNYTVNNTGLISAGGFEGSGFGVEVGGAEDGANTFTLINEGDIEGTGNGLASTTAAGDGIRIGNPGNMGITDGTITNSGSITSEGENGTVGAIRVVDGVGFQGTITNLEGGDIFGIQNGVYFGNGDHTGGVFTNEEGGLISSLSRAFNIDGTGLTVNNAGDIIGDDNQRNGTVYADATAQDFTLNNSGTIDAGEGNEGAGFSAELSEDGNSFTITNSGTIQGRGDAGAGLTTAGDGIRFERTRNMGMLDGTTTGLFTGTLTNTGTIASEGANGTVAGIRFVNGVSFQGTIDNSGTISGVQNGVYFGNPTPAGGGDHTGGVFNNLAGGVISSDSRAFNIDGLGLTLNNAGEIIGTGDQRNGTVYSDGTATNYTVNNSGTIDAGMGNDGSGFAAEIQAAGNTFTFDNSGTITGRGQGAFSDGFRVGNGGNIGVATVDITNSGTITSESTGSGAVAALRFVNGVSFAGVINNSGTIAGAQNGVYFGNAIMGEGADHSNGIFNNLVGGIISSDSRAFNIDGIGLTINNAGQIIGTGNQRNGTVYADATAQDFTLNNSGTIDAGEGNEGAGFSAELSEDGNSFTITNSGTIQGRGDAGAGLTTAGDGLRFERTRDMGSLMSPSTGLFTGTVTNTGTIASEGANGTVAGVRFVNGVSFQGTFDNSGTITGVQNGVYFGNPTPAGGGDHTGGIFNNLAGGVISSDSRAFNIDGIGLTLNNAGQIIGTGDQRNGTVYADGTADAYTLNNLAGGIIDAGAGNSGSGVSLQSGDVDGDAVSFTITNAGTIAGRGDALPSGAAAGLRVFAGAANVTVDGDITNTGTISSETAAAILIEGVNYTGTITNSGTLTGPAAFDASTALGAINFVNNGGALNGDFIGSSFTDTLTFQGASTLAGSILGDVNTILDAGSVTTVSGINTIEGDFTANGTLNFQLGLDRLDIIGDSTLGADSIINISTDADVTNLILDTPVFVLTETGDFTNNGTTVNINVNDDDLLVDFDVVFGSVAVVATAADLTQISDDANISSFGGALTSAFAAGALDSAVANALNDADGVAGFENAALSLLPTINEGVTREVFEAHSLAGQRLERRLRSNADRGIWVQAFGRTATRATDNRSNAGYSADTFGASIGADTKIGEQLTIGAAFNYANIDIDNQNLASENTELDSFEISAYAGLNTEAYFANAQIGYVFGDGESTRDSVTGAIAGDFDVDGFTAEANAGFDYQAGGFTITPSAGLRFASISQDTFSETGGLNLDVDADSVQYLDLRIGANFTADLEGFAPYARLGYAYDVIGDERSFDLNFAGAAAPFTLTSTEPSQSRFEIGAGFNLIAGNGFSIGVEYDGEFSNDYQGHGGFIRARVEF